jgi:hypothetical protein
LPAAGKPAAPTVPAKAAYNPCGRRRRTRHHTEALMNPEKVVFGFFILLAATLNFGFCLGDFDNPAHHHPYELFAAIVVNLIATVLKLGDRTQLGAVMLSTSLVADVGLIAAAIAWAIGVWGTGEGMTPAVLGSVLSWASGALFANVVSVILLIVETVLMRR